MTATPETARASVSRLASWRRWLPLLGLLLLGWVLARADWAAMAVALRRVDGRVLPLAGGLFLLNLAFKAMRWWRLVRAQGLPLPLPAALSAFFGAQFYGQLTVGRVGEFMRAGALTERGVRTAPALASCLVDRMLDLVAVILVVGGWGALTAGISAATAGAAGGVVLLLVVLGWVRLRLPRPGGGRGPRGDRAPRGAIGTRLLAAVRDLWAECGRMLRPGPMLEAALWTALAWTAYFATLWTLAGGMGLSVGRAVLSGAASLAALSALLPVTVSGLGAREVVFQQVLGLRGVSGESAIVLSMLQLTVMTSAALCGGLVGLWVRRHQRRARSASGGLRPLSSRPASAGRSSP